MSTGSDTKAARDDTSSALTQSAHGAHSAAAGEPIFTPGTMLAQRYRIVAPLGRGGMGYVYRADDVKLGQVVALKFLHGALSPERLERLYAEVRIGRQVSHPNVCRLYDIVEHAGHTFLAMEYVDGEDLGSLMARIGRLSKDKAAEIARELCSGLAAVHDRGVVHRDLKPANVMIDGRGRARLTDFGLAIALEAPGEDVHAGTPAYMAPEQLAGQEVTARSDVYAMGLLLFEMFAGRRFYDAKTLDELREQHARNRTRLQDGSREVDSSIERAIVQALDPDPANRPASGRALIALLPGGIDPLDAALAAGETPSPELVAASGESGEMRPLAAWGVLLLTFLCYAAAARISHETTLVAKAPIEKSPEVLLERAREIVKRLTADPRIDSAYSYELDQGFLDHVRRDDPRPDRWERLADARPGPYTFFYRQSPRTLLAGNRDAFVTRADPPSDVPGMAELVLDSRGQLLSFFSVPPRIEEPPATPSEPDWAALFRDAGLDPDKFAATTPHWAAPVDSDRKAAWSGAYPGPDAEPVRIEAAAYHGRPVWFAVLPRWAEASRAAGASEPTSNTPFTRAGLVVVALAIPLGGLLLARRNLRLGRGDRLGAQRVAAFVFASYSLARVFRADHAATPGDEVWVLIKLLAYPSLWAILVWILYVALEPHARRRWPRTLVSWKRLLSGQFRDPLVGRDVALGVCAGLVGLAVFQLPTLIARWWGAPVAPDTFIQGSTLTFERQALFRLFVNQYSAVQYGLMFLFLLVLLRNTLRSMPLAIALWCWFAATPLPGSEGSTLDWGFGLVRALAMLLVLLRLGLLGLVAMLFTMYGLTEIPLPLGFEGWQFPRAAPMLLACLALALYGFWTSLAGKSPFGRALLDD